MFDWIYAIFITAPEVTQNMEPFNPSYYMNEKGKICKKKGR